MTIKPSLRFWVIFILVGILFACIGYMFSRIGNVGIKEGLGSATDILPVSSEAKEDLKAVYSFGDYFLAHKDDEQVFLVLFQNNWELRPGGGFIGSFGIVKIKNGDISSVEVHDTANFDGRIPDTIDPPYPMEKYLHIGSWKFRDSNYSPDFPTNAAQAEMFYKMGGGLEEFDGIIGITTNVLISLLEVTGPLQIDGYPGTYDGEDAIYTLEHQVEQGYREQGIKKGDRKDVLNELARAVIDELEPINMNKKLKLARVALKNLKSKDIQLYFKNEELQKTVSDRNWGGKVDAQWQNDYLFVVDANLGGYKSDSVMERRVEYNVDLMQDNVEIEIKLTYLHTAEEYDWMINDYRTYTRVYVPQDAWLTGSEGMKEEDGIHFGDEFGKKYFGFALEVPVQTEKTVTLRYTLPEGISPKWHDLKIQKQAGVRNIPYKIHITEDVDIVRGYDFQLDSDLLLSDFSLE